LADLKLSENPLILVAESPEKTRKAGVCFEPLMLQIWMR
jgi:hypothetical protein